MNLLFYLYLNHKFLSLGYILAWLLMTIVGNHQFSEEQILIVTKVLCWTVNISKQVYMVLYICKEKSTHSVRLIAGLIAHLFDYYQYTFFFDSFKTTKSHFPKKTMNHMLCPTLWFLISMRLSHGVINTNQILTGLWSYKGITQDIHLECPFVCCWIICWVHAWVLSRFECFWSVLVATHNPHMNKELNWREITKSTFCSIHTHIMGLIISQDVLVAWRKIIFGHFYFTQKKLFCN